MGFDRGSRMGGLVLHRRGRRVGRPGGGPQEDGTKRTKDGREHGVRTHSPMQHGCWRLTGNRCGGWMERRRPTRNRIHCVGKSIAGSAGDAIMRLPTLPTARSRSIPDMGPKCIMRGYPPNGRPDLGEAAIAGRGAGTLQGGHRTERAVTPRSAGSARRPCSGPLPGSARIFVAVPRSSRRRRDYPAGPSSFRGSSSVVPPADPGPPNYIDSCHPGRT